jgi:hypothetical protein
MTTVTAYRYKDMSRGANFKYMHRPSGGSITNLWVKDYGYLQASGQTEYHRWEMNYPEAPNALPLTPRIEFTDSNAYYTNLYEFDARLVSSETKDSFVVKAAGELKDRNRWEGGVAFVLTHVITDNAIEKDITLRFHGQRPQVSIVEPFVQHENTRFTWRDERTVDITGGPRKFTFELLTDDVAIELGTDSERYRQPFPALQGFPITLKVTPDDGKFRRRVSYRIALTDP